MALLTIGKKLDALIQYKYSHIFFLISHFLFNSSCIYIIISSYYFRLIFMKIFRCTRWHARKAPTAQPAGPLQCSGATGGQRERPTAALFRPHAHADHRCGQYMVEKLPSMFGKSRNYRKVRRSLSSVLRRVAVCEILGWKLEALRQKSVRCFLLVLCILCASKASQLSCRCFSPSTCISFERRDAPRILACGFIMRGPTKFRAEALCVLPNFLFLFIAGTKTNFIYFGYWKCVAYKIFSIRYSFI